MGVKGFSLGECESTLESKSGKAILCTGGLLEKQKWIPKSQIHDDSEVWKPHQEGELIVSTWLAEQEGWL